MKSNEIDKRAWVAAISVHGAIIFGLMIYLLFSHRPGTTEVEKCAIKQVANKQNADANKNETNKQKRVDPITKTAKATEKTPKAIDKPQKPKCDLVLKGTGNNGGGQGNSSGGEKPVSVTWPSDLSQVADICDQNGSLLVAEIEANRFQQVFRDGGKFSLGNLSRSDLPMSNTMRVLDIDPEAVGIQARTLGVIVPATIDEKFREVARDVNGSIRWSKIGATWTLR